MLSEDVPMTELKARIPNIASIAPEVISTLQAFSQAGSGLGVPPGTIQLAQLRASQINGSSVCVDMHARFMQRSGETVERLVAVSAWRDSPLFSDAERSALALAECVTRLSDRPDPVPDDVWADATHHYDPKGLVGLLVGITAINAWNRLNVPTHQVAGEWIATQDSKEAAKWAAHAEGPAASAATRST
jgi:AhpD family alkylhydroperoxidase